MESIDPQQAFLEQLRNFYGAETHISASLPKMITAAGSGELKDVLNNHLQITRNQVSLLEKIFENLNEIPSGPTGSIVTGILQDEGIFVNSNSDNFGDDTDVIIEARKIHHYEMACFGSLVTLAGKMEDKKVEALLTTSPKHAPIHDRADQN